MNDLARATAPSRALDYRVAEALGNRVQVFRAPPESGLTGGLEFMFAPGSSQGQALPPYTGSLEVALSLIDAEDGYIFGRGRVRPDEPLYGCVLLPAGALDVDDAVAEAQHDVAAIVVLIAVFTARLRRTA